ncbi:MAG: ATP-binding cassette domain-containing protein [Bacteroidales bacterium]|nr:ATP-binding cassette domain-containing protein [Bacteroidales bacterium]
MMIKLENVTLNIESRCLFDRLSVEVPAGGRLLLRGVSGSGKTTLLRMLMGFVIPDQGKVFIDGEELRLDNVWQLRQKIAYVSQEMHIGRGKVERFIKEIFRFHNNRNLIYQRENVLQLFTDFQLGPEIIGKDLGDLSGGELQRVAIIVTLLLDRHIYLLDEVTSALDESLKELIVNYFNNLKDKTLIVSSHDKIWHDQHFITLNIGNHGSSS